MVKFHLHGKSIEKHLAEFASQTLNSSTRHKTNLAAHTSDSAVCVARRSDDMDGAIYFLPLSCVVK
jgi:hypothetical protein